MHKLNKGFTLLELIIVLVIVTIVGTMVINYTFFDEPERKAIAHHKKGEMVVSHLNDRKGQITTVRCWTTHCFYEIKFWTDEGFVTTRMEEYEFKKDDGF
jgi:prepilin-type N-terminal cleavage/methylation domain-containing protein